MKKFIKRTALSLTMTSILATATLSTQAFAIADVEGLSANAGVVSQYFFRGIAQTTTATASAGLDYEKGDFSVGAWVADVQDGIEVDVYGNYGFSFKNDLALNVGFTTYQYTGDFDSAYNELNFGASYKYLSLSYNIGRHEKDNALAIVASDYDFLSATFEYEGFYATYGTWGKDADGDYVELGYGTDVSGFDFGVALIANSSELDIETGKGDESLVFSIGKSF